MVTSVAQLDLYRTKVMLEFLSSVIPLRAPMLEWTDRKVWFYAGQRSVIDLINAKLNEEAPTGQPGEAR